MELNEIIEKAEEQHRLSQNELAKRIGMSPQNLSHVLRKRRKMPAEAAIELAELTGENAKRVWEAAKNYAARAAVVVMTGGCLLFSTPGEVQANQSVTQAQTPVIQIMAFLRRANATAKRLWRGLLSSLVKESPFSGCAAGPSIA